MSRHWSERQWRTRRRITTKPFIHGMRRTISSVDVGLVPGPFDEAPGIAAVREDMLDKWKAGAGSLQHALRAVTILNVGGMDTDGQQAAVGVGQDMTLAPVDLFTSVVALASPF